MLDETLSVSEIFNLQNVIIYVIIINIITFLAMHIDKKKAEKR